MTWSTYGSVRGSDELAGLRVNFCCHDSTSRTWVHVPMQGRGGLTTPGQQGVIRQVDNTLAITTAAQPSLTDWTTEVGHSHESA